MSRNIIFDKPKVKIDKIVIDLGDGKQIELSPEKAIELRDILGDLFPAQKKPAIRKEAPQKAEKKSEALAREEQIKQAMRELEELRKHQERARGTLPLSEDVGEVPAPYVRPFSPGPLAPVDFPWRKKLGHWTPMWAPTTNENIKDDGHRTMCIMAKQTKGG